MKIEWGSSFLWILSRFNDLPEEILPWWSVPRVHFFQLLAPQELPPCTPHLSPGFLHPSTLPLSPPHPFHIPSSNTHQLSAHKSFTLIFTDPTSHYHFVVTILQLIMLLIRCLVIILAWIRPICLNMKLETPPGGLYVFSRWCSIQWRQQLGCCQSKYTGCLVVVKPSCSQAKLLSGEVRNADWTGARQMGR